MATVDPSLVAHLPLFAGFDLSPSDRRVLRELSSQIGIALHEKFPDTDPLSVRFTDQPQRWAAAPALFMGSAGLLLIAGGIGITPVRALLEASERPATFTLFETADAPNRWREVIACAFSTISRPESSRTCRRTPSSYP